MLRDMAEQRFEQNILLPFVIEFDTSLKNDDGIDKYDLYFRVMSPEITLDDINDDGKIQLLMCDNFEGSAIGFIYHMTRYYMYPGDKEYKNRLNQATDKLNAFLIDKRNYNKGDQLKAVIIMDDPEVYSLIKATWLGKWISTMIELKEIIESRKKAEDIDLTDLLLE